MKSLIPALIALASIVPVQAISILHTVSEQSYFDLAAPYNAVGRVDLGGGSGTGTLISHNQILTAAHVLTDENDPTLVAAAGSITFLMGTNVDTPSYSLSIASVSVHPLWASFSNEATYDLAVLTLTTSFFDVTPISLSNINPSGMVGTMVGYGKNGDGQNFLDNEDGFRRAAQNVIDVVGTDVQTDFDSPSGDTSSFGTTTPLALEGTTVEGDSGGPLLVNVGGQMRIVGILHGGYNNLGDASAYGDVSIWAGFANPDNLNFLQSHGISIPEPSSAFLLFAGFFGLLLVRKRK